MKHDSVAGWIEAGKQVGTVLKFDEGGEDRWSSVGIQKWNGRYKVYVDEIRESRMVSEEYERETVREFATLDDAVRFVNGETRAKFCELRPCKGQKVFNPALPVSGDSE